MLTANTNLATTIAILQGNEMIKGGERGGFSTGLAVISVITVAQDATLRNQVTKKKLQQKIKSRYALVIDIIANNKIAIIESGSTSHFIGFNTHYTDIKNTLQE